MRLGAPVGLAAEPRLTLKVSDCARSRRSRAISRDPGDSSSIVYFSLKLRWSFDLAFGRGHDLCLLNVAHHVNDPFIDVAQLVVRQGALVGPAHVLKDGFLPIRLVDGQAGIALQLADLLRGPGPLVEQVHQAAVELVDLLAPVGNLHGQAFLNNYGRRPDNALIN